MDEVSESDLLEAIKDTLNREGDLDKLRAQLRSIITTKLNRNVIETEPKQISEETRFINELIREYLAWHGYFYTEQILLAESGQNNERLNRDVLLTKLGVIDDETSPKIPLLYHIIFEFLQKHNNNTSCT